MRKAAAGAWCILFLGASLLAGPLPAAGVANESESTLMQRADKQMLRYRAQIKNATMRLDQNLLGMGDGAPDPDAPTIPILPGLTLLENPRGTPEIIAVPQSGPIISNPFFSARSLSSISSSIGTLSLKRKTCNPLLRALIASKAANGPGTDITAKLAQRNGDSP